MAAAEQIKSLIKSFAEGDETRFFSTAMQIAAAEARQGHVEFAEELKKLIDTAKEKTLKNRSFGVVKNFPVNPAQKELNDLLELLHPKDKLKEMVLAPDLLKAIKRVLDEHRIIYFHAKNCCLLALQVVAKHLQLK